MAFCESMFLAILDAAHDAVRPKAAVHASSLIGYIDSTNRLKNNFTLTFGVAASDAFDEARQSQPESFERGRGGNV